MSESERERERELQKAFKKSAIICYYWQENTYQMLFYECADISLQVTLMGSGL